MKKTLAALLAATTLLSVAPVLGTSAAETDKVEGLTLTSYTFVAPTPEWGDAYKHLIGHSPLNYHLSFDGVKMFDQTIDELLDWSKKEGTKKAVTAFGNPDDLMKELGPKDSGNYLNNYLIQWKGKVTAAEDVKFTVVGNKIDNGFVLTIDGKRVYEYWGNAYFDKDDDKLPSDLGQVSLTKGEHEIEAWFLEIDGGAPLDMGVYLDGSEEYKSFADAGLTFAMDATAYHTIIDRWGSRDNEEHGYVKAFVDAGQKIGTGDNGEGQGGNGGQCIAVNQKYDATIDALLAASKKIGSIVVPRVDTLTLSVTDESYINMYDGFITVNETGYYLFGCEKVDNCFMIDIVDGKTTHRAFEFWANGTWNDNGSGAWMPETSAVRLEKGKTYGFKAAFMELDGGQVLWPRVKFSADGKTYGDAKEMNGELNYTTTTPTGTDAIDPAILTGQKVVLLNDKVKLDTVTHDMGDLWAGDGPITNIFDDNKDTKFGASGKWMGAEIKWETTEPTTVTHYKMVAAADNTQNPRVPLAWVLSGSNDGVHYEIIDKVARGKAGLAAVDSAVAVYAVDTPKAYKNYKIEVVSSWAGNDQDVAMSFADLSLYNITKETKPDTKPEPDNPNPPKTGSAVVGIAALAVISLAGVTVIAKKREQD